MGFNAREETLLDRNWAMRLGMKDFARAILGGAAALLLSGCTTLESVSEIGNPFDRLRSATVAAPRNDVAQAAEPNNIEEAATQDGDETPAASVEAVAEPQVAAAPEEVRTPPPAVYPTSGGSYLAVDALDFDPANAPGACVNDLRVYRAHLQAPGAARMDLGKPVNNYIQEAGGADAALARVNTRLEELRTDLDLELARRDPFDAQTRRVSDDAIARIEDSIMLNRALAEALECRR